jgi:hypothetical protein
MASKVEPLRKLLEARPAAVQPGDLHGRQDRGGELVDRIMKRPDLLKSLAAQAKPADGEGDGRVTAPPTALNPSTYKHPESRDGRNPASDRQGALEYDDFTKLLNKEFRPKTDEAKSAVEAAVKTLAAAGAGPDAADRQGRDPVDPVNDRRDRQEAHRADQRDHAPRRLPEAGRRVARAALPGQQHRDRRAAQDPRDEHQQERPAQDAQAVQGHELGPEPDLQAGLRGRVRPVRRRALRLRWWATTTSTTARPTSNAWPRSPRSRPRRTARSSRGPVLRCCRWTRWQELANPRDLPRSSARPTTRPGARCATATMRDVSRPGHAALPGASALRRQDQSGRRVRVRRRHRRRRPRQVHLGQFGLCDGDQHHPFVQDVRLVHADPGHRVGWRGREPAGAHLPDRRWRGGHEVPDRDRHFRSPRGRTRQGRD